MKPWLAPAAHDFAAFSNPGAKVDAPKHRPASLPAFEQDARRLIVSAEALNPDFDPRAARQFDVEIRASSPENEPLRAPIF
jgi:hypothetical protein